MYRLQVFERGVEIWDSGWCSECPQIPVFPHGRLLEFRSYYAVDGQDLAWDELIQAGR